MRMTMRMTMKKSKLNYERGGGQVKELHDR